MYHNRMNSTKRRFLICIYNKIEINFGFKIDSNHQCQFENFRRNVEEIKSSKTCYNLFLSIKCNLQYSNICHTLLRQKKSKKSWTGYVARIAKIRVQRICDHNT